MIIILRIVKEKKSR